MFERKWVRAAASLAAVAGLGACADALVPGPGTVTSSDGTEIHYTVSGSGDETLVLVHGWAGDQTYWQDQVRSLSDDFSIVTVDLGGHGLSGADRTDWSIERFSEDVVAVVEGLDLDRAVLVGHSLGGPVVLEAASAMPDRIGAVLGVDTFHDSWTAAGAFDGLLEQLEIDFQAAAAPFVRTMFLESSPQALADRIVADMVLQPPASGIAALDGLNGWGARNMESAIAQLPVPLGLIQSQLFSGAMTRVEATAPDTPVTTLDGLGHFLMSEDPARFDSALRSMVAQLLAESG